MDQGFKDFLARVSGVSGFGFGLNWTSSTPERQVIEKLLTRLGDHPVLWDSSSKLSIREILNSLKTVRKNITSALAELPQESKARDILLPIRRGCQEFQSFVEKNTNYEIPIGTIHGLLGKLREQKIGPALKILCERSDIEFDKNVHSARILELPTSTKRKRKSGPKKSEHNINMNIQGDGNIQIAGDYVTKKPHDIKILPPPDSIGADPLLKERITTLFNKIGEEREKRFGSRAYPAMYNKFKKDFGIKQNQWTIIWTWPKECAQDIIKYLEAKYENTIQGRIERAAKRPDHIHSRPYLYKREKELLENLGLSMKSPEFREFLRQYCGVDGHSELTPIDHWKLVRYLETIVKHLEEQ